MKYEWRKKDKDIYLPKGMEIKEMPKMQYIILEGQGNPNGDQFLSCIEALYALSYGLKMSLKKREDLKEAYDYTVFPLEAIWSLNSEGQEKYKKGIPVIELKDDMVFKVMIRQPDFIDQAIYDQVQSDVLKKKRNDLIGQAQLKTLEEGLVAQMIHLGSYDDEPESFRALETFLSDHGYKRSSKDHKEIYISDPRRVSVDKLKTTIRVWIETS